MILYQFKKDEQCSHNSASYEYRRNQKENTNHLRASSAKTIWRYIYEPRVLEEAKVAQIEKENRITSVYQKGFS